jgi:hypothetical protein
MRPDPRANARQEGLRHMKLLFVLYPFYDGHPSPSLITRQIRVISGEGWYANKNSHSKLPPKDE